ncbi:MAG: glycosyltransferase, partial [Planctomycetota bacterium]
GETLRDATTIVMPVHNKERTLRSLIWSVLDLADSLNTPVELVIVDDGSRDETFETACEISRTVPQVHALREPVRCGLKPILQRVWHEMGAASVIAHDGDSLVDLTELATLLRESGGAETGRPGRRTNQQGGRGSRRFASFTTLNARMQQAHRAITSFRWMHRQEDDAPRRRMRLETSKRPTSAEGAADRTAQAMNPPVSG